MTKTIAITAIVLVAVVMGMSSVVTMMPNAYAGVQREGFCPRDFAEQFTYNISRELRDQAQLIDGADGTLDFIVCVKEINAPRTQAVRTIIVDNNIPIST